MGMLFKTIKNVSLFSFNSTVVYQLLCFFFFFLMCIYILVLSIFFYSELFEEPFPSILSSKEDNYSKVCNLKEISPFVLYSWTYFETRDTQLFVLISIINCQKKSFPVLNFCYQFNQITKIMIFMSIGVACSLRCTGIHNTYISDMPLLSFGCFFLQPMIKDWSHMNM